MSESITLDQAIMALVGKGVFDAHKIVTKLVARTDWPDIVTASAEELALERAQILLRSYRRDTEKEARKFATTMKEANTGWAGPTDGPFGPPELVAEKWAPYLDLGFDHFYVDCPAPFDHETLERLTTEVKPALEAR